MRCRLGSRGCCWWKAGASLRPQRSASARAPNTSPFITPVWPPHPIATPPPATPAQTLPTPGAQVSPSRGVTARVVGLELVVAFAEQVPEPLMLVSILDGDADAFLSHRGGSNTEEVIFDLLDEIVDGCALVLHDRVVFLPVGYVLNEPTTQATACFFRDR